MIAEKTIRTGLIYPAGQIPAAKAAGTGCVAMNWWPDVSAIPPGDGGVPGGQVLDSNRGIHSPGFSTVPG